MNHIILLLVVHNHQPVGNFGWVIEEAYQRAYKPFLDVLAQYPQIKVTLHYSGCLLLELKRRHEEFFHQLKAMIDRGQVEILSGGIGEPILPSIPERDALAQISEMNDFLLTTLGVTPRGLWLTERVWEPYLPKIIRQAGLEFTLVDDHHFFLAGIKPEQLCSYWLTEGEGKTLSVFPIDKELRYLIPSHAAEEAIDYLRRSRQNGPGIKVMGDDGEKFGLWPSSYELCYEKGWLAHFFDLLLANSSWLETRTCSQTLSQLPSAGRIYLPCASYPEMMAWSLVSPKEGTIGKKEVPTCGLWRNFLAYYEEANNMHKKMLYVSEKVATCLNPSKELKRELFLGQCNCAYWHGLFGGLFLPHLRFGVYEHLIKAEKKADEELGRSGLSLCEGDFDCDGKQEILCEGPLVNLYFSPEKGGSLFEWDYKPLSFNFSATLSRYEELPFVEAKQRRKFLALDSLPPYSFLLHIFTQEPCPEDLMKRGDFIDRYSLKRKESDHSLATISLEGEERVNAEGKEILLHLLKTFQVHEHGVLKAELSLENLNLSPVDLWCALEINLASISGFDPERFMLRSSDQRWALNKPGFERNTYHSLQFFWPQEGLALQVNFEPEAAFFIIPIETKSSSEQGFERIIQGISFFPLWKIKSKPGVPGLIRAEFSFIQAR